MTDVSELLTPPGRLAEDVAPLGPSMDVSRGERMSLKAGCG